MILIPIFKPFISPVTSTSISSPAATADMLLWLNASNIVASNGDSLTFWTDDGPSHRSVTASTAVVSDQPKYKTNIINGKPAVLFGTGSFKLAPFPTASAESSSAELWIILQAAQDPTANSTQEGPVFMRSGSSGAEAVPFTDGKLYEPFYSAQITPNVHTDISKSVVLTIPTLYNVLSENRHMSIYYRGEIIYSNDNNPVPAGGAWGALSHSIGSENGALLWPGYISELIVYGRKLTDTERVTTNNYLVSKYNVDYIIDSASLSPRTFNVGGAQSLTGWWDANNITGSNSSSISSWTDLSGNGNNLTQSISASQPVLFTSVYSGSSTATVRFTSSAYYLATTTPFTQATNAPFTFMTVCKATVANSSVLSNAATNIQFRVFRASANQNDFFPGSNELIASFGNQPAGTFQLNVWTRDSGSGVVNMWQNGLKVAAGTNGDSFTWNRVADGTANTVPFVGDISEMAWFNYSLNDYSIYKLYDLYFRPKWGLPGGHF